MVQGVSHRPATAGTQSGVTTKTHGKPAWAGGPNSATALPPGIAKNVDKLPSHNPWVALNAALQEQAKAKEEEKETTTSEPVAATVVQESSIETTTLSITA